MEVAEVVSMAELVPRFLDSELGALCSPLCSLSH